MTPKLVFVWFSYKPDLKLLRTSMASVKDFFPDAHLHLQFDGDLNAVNGSDIPQMTDSIAVSNLPHNSSNIKLAGEAQLCGLPGTMQEIETFAEVIQQTKADYIIKIDSDVLCLSNSTLTWLTKLARYHHIGSGSTMPTSYDGVNRSYRFARGPAYALHKNSIALLPKTEAALETATEALANIYGPRLVTTPIEDEIISLLAQHQHELGAPQASCYLDCDNTDQGGLLRMWTYQNHPDNINSGNTAWHAAYDFVEFGRRSSMPPSATDSDPRLNNIIAHTMQKVYHLNKTPYNWPALK